MLNIYYPFSFFFSEYGFPEASELKVQSNIIASSLLSLRLEYKGKVVTKNIPPSMLIQKVTTLAQKTFKLQERPVLTGISATDANIVVKLEDEMKELGYYSMQDGDTIIVQMSS